MSEDDKNNSFSSITEELQPPKYPESWECCGSDCGDACVYTIYAREKEEYDRQAKLLKSLFDGDTDNASD